MNGLGLATPMARFVWEQRYRHGGHAEPDIAAPWRRAATALASAEPAGCNKWAQIFFKSLRDFRFLPGGRILAGAGTPHRVTLLNCFVMGRLEDSLPGIFRALQEGAVTMAQGGGVGYDFSPLSPRGAAAMAANGLAAGPVAFMAVWDAMCATIRSTGARRGAMMATLRCDHPDIEDFIAAKLCRERCVTSIFPCRFPMRSCARCRRCAVDLHFPAAPALSSGTRSPRQRHLAKSLACGFASGEPGVLFVDRSTGLIIWAIVK